MFKRKKFLIKEKGRKERQISNNFEILLLQMASDSTETSEAGEEEEEHEGDSDNKERMPFIQ